MAALDKAELLVEIVCLTLSQPLVVVVVAALILLEAQEDQVAVAEHSAAFLQAQLAAQAQLVKVILVDPVTVLHQVVVAVKAVQVVDQQLVQERPVQYLEAV
jgi:hypothetical protein